MPKCDNNTYSSFKSEFKLFSNLIHCPRSSKVWRRERNVSMKRSERKEKACTRPRSDSKASVKVLLKCARLENNEKTGQRK